MILFQQNTARGPSDSRRRIFSRLVTDSNKQPESTTQFQAVFDEVLLDFKNGVIKERSHTETYLPIDSGKFEILSAVPGLPISKQVIIPNTEKGNNKKNSISPMVPGVEIKNPKARANKAIQTAQDVYVPAKFSAIPAVPIYKESQSINQVADHASVNVAENFIEEVRDASSVKIEKSLINAKEERRRFKKCHGRCVQKFCLPVGNLTVFENCSVKCKGICTS